MASAASLAALLNGTSIDDHEEVLQAAQASLKASRKDTSAQLAQVVALLKLDRFQEAARAVEDAGSALRAAAPLEYAYALYKTSALQDADKVLAEHGKKETSLMHMKAQIAYRREDFTRSASIYKTLNKQQFADSSEESDFRINSSAIDAQLAWAGQSDTAARQQPKREDLEHFETAFNAACGYVARGDLRPAEFLLTRARDLCNAAEELSEDEKQAEIIPIQTQLVCVLCWQGKYEEAVKAASSVHLKDITDAATQRIAQVNLLAARGADVNPYLAQRAFDSTDSTSLNSQLFSFQKSVLARNAMVVDLQAHKFSRVQRSAADNALAGVYAAAAHARNQQGEAAIKELLPLVERRPGDLGLIMTVIQLYVLTDNPQMATSLLEKFLGRLEQSTAASDLDTRFAPGLVGLAVSLYAGQNRITTARLELVKAAKHWRRKPKDSQHLTGLFKAAGAALLENPTDDDEELAQELFGIIKDASTGDTTTLAGLLASGSEGEGVGAHAQESSPSLEELTTGVDATDLEAAGVARLAKSTTSPASRERPVADGSKPSKPKKIRKSRLPKDYDPSKTPDPERWLPLRDRSSYRPKGKKKAKASQGMATQGGIAAEDARPSTPQQQQVKPAANAKSKKKKGKGGK